MIPSELLELFACSLWTLAYCVVIWRQHVDTGFQMPIEVLALNASWELLHGIFLVLDLNSLGIADRAALAIDTTWLLLDVIIIVQTIRNSRRFGEYWAGRCSPRRLLALVPASLGFHVLVNTISSDWSGYYSGFVTDIAIFFGIAWLLRTRRTNEGASLAFLLITVLADLLLICCFTYWNGQDAFAIVFLVMRILGFVLCIHAWYKNRICMPFVADQHQVLVRCVFSLIIPAAVTVMAMIVFLSDAAHAMAVGAAPEWLLVFVAIGGITLKLGDDAYDIYHHRRRARMLLGLASGFLAVSSALNEQFLALALGGAVGVLLCKKVDHRAALFAFLTFVLACSAFIAASALPSSTLIGWGAIGIAVDEKAKKWAIHRTKCNTEINGYSWRYLVHEFFIARNCAIPGVGSTLYMFGSIAPDTWLAISTFDLAYAIAEQCSGSRNNPLLLGLSDGY